jgi:3-dehydroquinate synthase
MIALLQQYELPTRASFPWKKVEKVMAMDKKKSLTGMQYILLENIGKAVVHTIPVNDLIFRLKKIK